MLTRAGNCLTLIAACLLLTCAVAHGAEPRGVVYKFGATWCGPCQRVAPMIERLEREGLPIQSVDIDQQEELANRFRVDRVPTFILVVDGQEVDRVVGMMTEYVHADEPAAALVLAELCYVLAAYLHSRYPGRRAAVWRDDDHTIRPSRPALGFDRAPRPVYPALGAYEALGTPADHGSGG